MIAEVNVDTSSYEEGHIPGAVGWNWRTQLCNTTLHDIFSISELEKFLGESRISNDTAIVVYGESSDWFAAWEFYQFNIYGHRDVRIMDGSRTKWLAEDGPLSTEANSPSPVSYVATALDHSQRTYLNDVRHALGSGFELVDVQSTDEFAGRILAPPRPD